MVDCTVCVCFPNASFYSRESYIMANSVSVCPIEVFGPIFSKRARARARARARVSALIHAATMVTAGVFLIIRSGPFFEG